MSWMFLVGAGVVALIVIAIIAMIVVYFSTGGEKDD